METDDPETGKRFDEITLRSFAGNFMYTISVFMSNFTSIGGSDTTATSLTYLLYHLLANRVYWDRLAAEVLENVQSVDDIFKSTFNLPFLDAVVKESITTILRLLIIVLRHRPPSPANLQREVCYPGTVVDGHFLAGGVIGR
jgi:cytochrome P450